MSAGTREHAAPSVDGDGVRVIRTGGTTRTGWAIVVLVLIAAGSAWFTLRPSPRLPRPISPPVASGMPIPPPVSADVASVPPAPRPIAVSASAAPASDRITPSSADWRTGDANDLATYASPGDPEPTGAELIQALRASGETAGIAAFNPPGTSPPMVGLAVPEDFVLPEGYVRHHQVTDDGQPLEAILMYSPDYVLRDAAGRVIPMPEDRVVPPDMAPPGLPIRQIEIPPPAE